jgi:hypothetical protein
MLTVLTVDSTVFTDVVPCNLLEVYRRFGEMYCFHLQDRKIKQESISQSSACCLLHGDFLFGFPFDPEDGIIDEHLPDYTASYPRR